MTKEALKQAEELFNKLPDPYKAIALEIIENEILGKKNANEKIMKRLKAINYKVTEDT